MPLLLACDWNRDALDLLEADVGGGRVSVQRLARVPWPAAIDRDEDAAGIGSWLKEALARAGFQAQAALFVLPREEVVTRRLELPNAPDDELPEMVRFQAATKSATPLDQLVLDFVPLPSIDGETGRPVLAATIERRDLEYLQRVCAAAGLTLQSLQASPFSVAEVAVRYERQHDEDPQATTLVIYQSGTRVELSILQRLGLVFTHQTRIDPQDERSLRATLAEINRSVVTLGQMLHTTVDVARVCLIHDAQADQGLERALGERFGAKLQVIDPAEDAAVQVAPAISPQQLAGMAPAIGALLARLQATVPAVDFVTPRRTPPKKDLRRERMIQIGAAAAALVLLAGGSGWLYSRHLDAQIRSLQIQDGELTTTLKNAEKPLDVHEKLAKWRLAKFDPLAELDRLNRLLPGTDRLLLLNVQVQPPRGEALARITAGGIARSDRDINDLFDTLTANGYRLQPQVSETYKLDPDYPRKFTLDASRLPPAPVEATPAKK